MVTASEGLFPKGNVYTNKMQNNIEIYSFLKQLLLSHLEVKNPRKWGRNCFTGEKQNRDIF